MINTKKIKRQKYKKYKLQERKNYKKDKKNKERVKYNTSGQFRTLAMFFSLATIKFDKT